MLSRPRRSEVGQRPQGLHHAFPDHLRDRGALILRTWHFSLAAARRDGPSTNELAHSGRGANGHQRIAGAGATRPT